MAIVEDEVRNESEEENEIGVILAEEEADAGDDPDDSDIELEEEEEDDDEELILEKRVLRLESCIAKNPNNYLDHVDLIQTLWGLSSLERWRVAFDRLQQLTKMKAEHWLMRLQTEVSLAHNDEARERVAKLFQDAAIDCYSIPILSEWCSWALTVEPADKAREQLEEVLRRAGADPFSGKIFWDAKFELEKNQLENLSEEDTEYKAQKERVLWCLEETVSRPLLRGEEALQQMEEIALSLHSQDYVDKVKKQHEYAVEFLHRISPFEDQLLTLDSPKDKLKVYLDYIKTLKKLALNKRYAECDTSGILRVVYDRASTECGSEGPQLYSMFASHVRARSSRATYARVLGSLRRRAPTRALPWELTMQQAEKDGESFEQIKTIFETALARGMESFSQSEELWLSYLEYLRRISDFNNEKDVDRLRRTFRLAWDTLAETYNEEADDSEVPIFWARIEYRLLNDPKQGRMIFEEILSLPIKENPLKTDIGDNKTISKFWEVLLALEFDRKPRPSDQKLRDLMKRALKDVRDFPPVIIRMWTAFERDYGTIETLQECKEICQTRLRDWHGTYEAMRKKMLGKKSQDGNPKASKKPMIEKLLKGGQQKGKRKSDGGDGGGESKRKKEEKMDVDEKETKEDNGVKRSHEEGDEEVGESKRQRTSSSSPHRLGTRDACTLFISNLEFKVDEQKLRDILSQYGDIISLRVRKGIKAFGGSICYCQYKTPEAVDEAIKHDRIPLDGRPMFLSRYSAKKSKPAFKYSTEEEKNKLFVKNLPFAHCTKDALADVFDKYGKLKDVRIVTHKDGKPKGLAYIEYEDEASAAEAVSKVHGMMLADRKLDVAFSAPPPRQAGAAASDAPALGQAKRDAGGGGMRRTQLSSFIPSVLQKAAASTSQPQPSTSAASTNGSHSNADDKRPLSNSDFRTMLLKKQ
ncbi:squamous cell carcinoma antigen recognized by T-cells 3 isoform X1 [Spodoptera frugiperda]|uniref:Squamous cell carcinoma antigen recognized by T-cells 3 isoform X1 n=1 Tax=Spodoptera frugiperda TaxID=7108 RepID=A0A9R0DCK6_SPOFR|nr:squamous cell carcinoma antigen recognized by T-cells 3 isoform X1 [Spodoptera frugiperda]